MKFRAKMVLPIIILFFWSSVSYSFVDYFQMRPGKKKEELFNNCKVVFGDAGFVRATKEFHIKLPLLERFKATFKRDSVKKKEHLRYYLRPVKGKKGYLIYYHGSARSACTNVVEILPNLKDLPLNVAIIEYPGYGGDTVKGHPSEARILVNALDMYDEIKKINSKKLPIIIYGGSMGTTIATYVASKRDASGLILRNPMTSMEDAAHQIFKKMGKKGKKFISKFMKSKFKSVDWAPNVKAPTLILHAQDDEWVPLAMARRLAGRFKTDLKFVEIVGGKHMTNHTFPQYRKEIQSFIKRIMKVK
jgi:pimeloyl-ACP methyl ester carboxylesterase